jgi:hypothetical protein
MTKADWVKGNAALTHLQRTGEVILKQEEEEMRDRKEDGYNSNRSKTASKEVMGKE